MTCFSYSSDLVVDLGMNNGDDTAYYLALGFRVAAVEANPALCQAAASRFSTALASGRLHIINAAIWRSNEKRAFHINQANDHWSSLDLAWAGRDGHPLSTICVDGLSVTTLFAQVGSPFFMKIDIEGADEMVIDQLAMVEQLPPYLSIEDCRFGQRYIEKMIALGYSGFQLLDQSEVHQMADTSIGWRFPKGASGPFGRSLPGPWLNAHRIQEQYTNLIRDRTGYRHSPRTHWWDIHARA